MHNRRLDMRPAGPASLVASPRFQPRVRPPVVLRRQQQPASAAGDLEGAVLQRLERARRRPTILQALAQRSWTGSGLPDGSAFGNLTPEIDPEAGSEPIQRLFLGSNVIDSAAFQGLTPAARYRARKAVRTIDAALDLYHVSNQGNALANLDNLLLVINDYIRGKRNDRTNVRLAPATNLALAAMAERPAVQRLDELHQQGVAADLTNVGTVMAIPGSELRALAALPQRVTLAQIVQLDALPRANREIVQLAAPAQVATFQDLLDLVLSTRPIAEVLTLAAAGAPTAVTGPVGRAATAIARVPPPPTAVLVPGEYGATYPESIRVTLTARLAGGRWYCALTHLNGCYWQQARLLPGQSEITGPSGNTDEQNYAEQGANLRALGSLPGNPWYMLQAVQEHEDVHLRGFQPALETVEPEIQTLFLGLSVPYGAGVDNAGAAVAAIQLLPGCAAALRQGYRLWLSRAEAWIARDHARGGPTDVAELAVVNPMIDSINAAAGAGGWGPPI